MVNWSVLEPFYTRLDGIDAFEPTPESVVGQTKFFVAARDDEAGTFHYFLSGRTPGHSELFVVVDVVCC